MPFSTARSALEYRSRPRPTGPPPICSRRRTGSREKGTDHGKKDTGEGGAQAEVVDPVAQRDRRGPEHDVAWEEAERMSAGEVYARLFPDWDAVHAEFAKVGVTFRLLHGEYREKCAAQGEAAKSCRTLLQAVQAVHGRQERREQGRPQGGQEHGGRLVRPDHVPRRPGDRRRLDTICLLPACPSAGTATSSR